MPEALGELLLYRWDTQWLFTVLQGSPGNRLLVGRSLGVIAEDEKADDFFSPEDLLEHWKLFEEYAHLEVLVGRVGVDGRLGKLARSKHLDLDQTKLVQTLIESGPDDPDLLDWCAVELQSISGDEWLGQLKTKGSLLELALACAQKGKAVGLGGPFREAIGNLATELACTTESEEIDWSSVKEIVFGLLGKANRGVLRDDLAAVLAKNAKEAPVSFFHLFGDEIAADRRLRSNATLATSVMVPLLERRNQPGLNWLRTVLEQDHDLLKEAMPDNRSAFESDLAIALRDGTEDEAQGELRRIAAVLGVKQAQKAEPHEEPEESARS